MTKRLRLSALVTTLGLGFQLAQAQQAMPPARLVDGKIRPHHQY